VYTEIELGYQVAQPQHYVAVTGTNGKTTTVSLIYEILKANKEHVYIGGNYGIPYCDIVMDHKLYENEGATVVLEMSNFQLLDIDSFHPQVAAVTNLTPDHLDYMDSLDDYYASKMRIYENCDANDTFIRNDDDATLADYLVKFPPKAKVETFSTSHHANCELKGATIYYNDQKVIDRKDIKIVGMHNVQNIMLAIIACAHSGVAIEKIAAGIAAFKGVEHRLEYVEEIDGVKYYNDSKGTNTDAAVIAIKAFEKPVILLMGGHEKNLDVADVAKYNDHIKTLITFGEAGQRFARDMHHPDTYVCEHMKDAVLKAHEIAKKDDVVLLSPSTSSFDEFNNMAERGNAFKDLVKTFE
jgi:UDP-N-acetylmuramoylalanine--D-glutamate ligase